MQVVVLGGVCRVRQPVEKGEIIGSSRQETSGAITNKQIISCTNICEQPYAAEYNINLQDREGDSDQHVNDSIQEERNSKYAQNVKK